MGVTPPPFYHQSQMEGWGVGIGERANREPVGKDPACPQKSTPTVFTLGANGDPGSFWDQNRLLPGIVIQAALGFSAGVPKVGGRAARP